MGRQFQVYLLPSDAANLVELIRQQVGLSLLASRTPTPNRIEIETPIRINAGFARVDCLLAPDDSAVVKIEHLEKQNQWTVNTLFSEVIEFNGCHFDERTLKRGRLFYDKGFYLDELWLEKSINFLKWAELVFKVAKKSLNRISSLDAYVGADAAQWRSNGGVLLH